MTQPPEHIGQQGSPWGEPAGTPGYGAAPQRPPAAGEPPAGAPGQEAGPQQGAPQYGAPQYGAPQYGAPQYGAPQYGAPQYGAPTGFVPAPVQPGIVPLRPLGLGEVFDGAFRAVRDNPRVMFGLPAIVVGIGSLLAIALTYALLPLVSPLIGDLFDQADPTGSLTSLTGLYAVTGASSVGVLPMSFIASTVLTGLLTASVSQSVIGKRITVGEVWRRYGRRTLLLIPYSILLGLAMLLGWALLLAPGVAALASGAEGGGLTLMLLGLLGGAVAQVWVTVRTLLVPPVMVLEGGGLRSATVRGWTLTRGSFWRLLGIYVLAFFVVSVVQQVIAVPVGVIAGFASVAASDFGLTLSMVLGSAMGLILTLAFLAPVVALLYIDVRIRKEGLDVALARAAEQA